MRSRNTKIAVLILLGLVLFTAMGFIVVKYSASQGQIARDERVIQNLSNELQQMEENMIEIRVLFEDNELQVNEANQLLQEKSEMLNMMEKEIEKLKQEGRLSQVKIEELEEELQNARNRILVQKQEFELKAYSKENAKLLARIDSMNNGLLTGNESLQRENSKLKEENGILRGRLYELELEREEVTSLQAAGFTFFNIKSGKRSPVYNNYIKASDLKELDVCFELVKNTRIEGTKDLYLQIQSPTGIYYENFDGFSRELKVGGQTKIFTAATTIMYKRKAKNVCINFRPSGSKPFIPGIQVIYLYSDGKIIGTEKLELK